MGKCTLTVFSFFKNPLPPSFFHVDYKYPVTLNKKYFHSSSTETIWFLSPYLIGLIGTACVSISIVSSEPPPRPPLPLLPLQPHRQQSASHAPSRSRRDDAPSSICDASLAVWSASLAYELFQVALRSRLRKKKLTSQISSLSHIQNICIQYVYTSS